MKKSERKAEQRKNKSAGAIESTSGTQQEPFAVYWARHIRALLLTALLLLVSLLFMAIEFSPISQVASHPDEKEQNNIMMALSKTAVQLQQAKSKQQKYFTVKLTQDEVNSLLTTALMVIKSKSSENAPMIYGQWSAGKLHAEISYMQSGVYFTLRCIALVSVNDRKLNVSISDSTLGMLPIPPSAVEECINEELAKLSASREMQVFFDVVKSFSFDNDGNALVTISAQRAPELLLSIF